MLLVALPRIKIEAFSPFGFRCRKFPAETLLVLDGCLQGANRPEAAAHVWRNRSHFARRPWILVGVASPTG